MFLSAFETNSKTADTAWGDTETAVGLSLSSLMHEDMTELFLIEKSERYYMIFPKRYFFIRGIRVMLLFLVCILFCRSYFIVGVPPGLWIACMQFSKFRQFMDIVNVSSKKLYVMLAIWIVVCIGINIVFWNWLLTIW